MKFGDQSTNLRIELDTKNCTLTEAQIRKLEEGLAPLRKPVANFPVSDLYITIYFHPRSNEYRVKTALVLTKRTLFTGDVDPQIYPAFERCIRKLVARLTAYKASLAADAEQAKQVEGTHQEVLPTLIPDIQQVEAAVDQGDYAAFREATYPYEEPVRKRLGRWISRYPDMEEQLDDRIKLADLVEEVFLNAFERYAARPREVRFGDWLESLIDPSVKLVLTRPDDEMANIEFARTLRGLPPQEA